MQTVQLEDEFPHDAQTLRRLKFGDTHFCNLAERYHALGRALDRIESGAERASDAHTARLRKQRLSLLDEIAMMLEQAERSLVHA